MAVDPVCNMEMDETTAEYQSSFAGKTYFFCSEDCYKEFVAHPELYVPAA